MKIGFGWLGLASSYSCTIHLQEIQGGETLSALSCPAPQPHERSDQIRSACVVVLDELKPAGPVHFSAFIHVGVLAWPGSNLLVLDMFFGGLEGKDLR